MAFNCVGVSGCASGSLRAAAVITLSSSTLGMRTVGRLEIFDIVLYLASIGTTKTDDSSRLCPVNKCHAVQGFGLGCERDHSHLVVFKPIINPYQRRFPVEFNGHAQRQAMLGLVGRILDRIELDVHCIV
jgi:hypothetical protein